MTHKTHPHCSMRSAQPARLSGVRQFKMLRTAWAEGFHGHRWQFCLQSASAVGASCFVSLFKFADKHDEGVCLVFITSYLTNQATEAGRKIKNHFHCQSVVKDGQHHFINRAVGKRLISLLNE